MSAETNTETMGNSQTLDRTLDAIRDRHRRGLLLALLEQNPLPGMRTFETGGTLDDVFHDDPRATSVRMHHMHLPKLEQMGYIERKRDRGEIHTGPKWNEIEPVLQLFRDFDGDYVGV
ncbi:ArsR family transcriptional regulator [Haloarcula marina]|uniref:ArsR family transcriptional regulator n=1 Tax=Haloarcula marina TaxID=2961574 RepID=UPI0020B8218D|nr:ArsR family transcriptional regulator [Halomicroarcula marina]